MRYEFTVNGRTRQVVVSRQEGGLAVIVDGRAWRVDAARVTDQIWSLILDGTRSREVSVNADPATGQLLVRLGTVPVQVAAAGRSRFGRRGDAAHAGSEPQRVTAPMPGKIVRVLATPGDTVTARQPLVVVEAMKMENELRAGRDGTVTAVHVQQGQSVDAGTLLVVIE